MGGLVGFFVDREFLHNKCDKSLQLVNEEIRCSKVYAIEKYEYIQVKQNILAYLEKEKEENKLTRFSVYFRDLDNGPTFGINEKDGFVPASLLKLPLMIAYYRSKDEGKDLMKDKLKFDWEVAPVGEQYNFKPKMQAETGVQYTAEELISYMIKYSDNASYLVLLQHLRNSYPDSDYLLDTFKDIGIIDPGSVYEESINTKSYASLFRALYNASYLSKKSSEESLETLLGVDFKDGLNMGIPRNIKIAHKFGERGSLPDNQKELHDCGIVYFPQNPYLLCVMVEGADYTNMSAAIGHVSKLVYDEVYSRKI